MAVITPTVTKVYDSKPAGGHGPALLVTWANILEADTCTPYEAPLSLPDRTVQMESGGESGFDSATITLVGSINGTNYRSLTDPQGNAIAKTAAALEAVSELTRYINVTTAGGAAASNVTVSVLLCGPRRGG